ncbi:hypothetical protein ILUMI_22992 [Ignelater luminosus]|uniref:Transposase Tc1-like domain-containing protein n=1 Tax=Ignelater luminosus TaxID=2038154 RepID=A0A8K0C8Z3_IGNLU|nr:hypothetical protein ILUMI_22992 [Ignelater luminosus]
MDNGKYYKLEDPRGIEYLLHIMNDVMALDSDVGENTDADDNIPLSKLTPRSGFAEEILTKHVSLSARLFNRADSSKSPGNSPDLNPIENVWAIMSKLIAEEKPKPRFDHNKVELTGLWKFDWERLLTNQEQYTKSNFDIPFGITRNARFDIHNPLNILLCVLTNTFLQFICSRRMDMAVKSKIKTLSDLSWFKKQIAKEEKGSGRKRKASQREDICIKRPWSRNRTIISKEIQKELEEPTNIKISDCLVRYRLKKLGFCSRRPAKNPLLNKKMKEKLLLWAKERKTWGVSEWKKGYFSDQSRFNLVGSDGGVKVWRKQGERFKEECIIPAVKHSPYVMVGGCITFDGTGSIIMLKGTVNAEKYKDPIFQDDSAPCHRAQTIQEYKEYLNINSLPWPGDSLDLNPIKNVWAIMSKRIAEEKPKPKFDHNKVELTGF